MIDVPARVKDALRDGRLLKNYKFAVLNDDGTTDFTIDNDTLVSESVKVDERMCTGNQLKFGLCEGSSLEFQYFDHPNITGRQIQAFIDVQYVDADNELQWYEIPMGFFTVDQCPMQFSTGIRKVTAYNKLRSAYLDQKANDLLAESYADTNFDVTLFDIKRTLLGDYQIETPKELQTPTMDLTTYYGQLSFKSSDYDTEYFPDGDTSPLNYWNREVWMPTAAVTVIMDRRYFVLDPSKKYVVDSWYNLDDLETWLYSATDTVLQKSGIKTPSNYMNQMLSSISKLLPGQPAPDHYTDYNFPNGWMHYFGVILIKSDDSWEYYSGIKYAASMTGCVGNGSDLMHKIITGYKAMYLNVPITLNFDSVDPDGPGWQVFKDAEYTYKTDSNHDLVTAVYPAMADNQGNTVILSKTVGEEAEYFFKLSEVVGEISDADLITVNPETLPDVTLRDLTSATFETVAQYGKLSRTTDLFSGVELNGSRLLPADTLYPSDTLYPMGNSVRANKSMYQKLWTDSQGVQSFRYLIITYKGLDENNQEVEKVLQRTVNADGTTDYNMSDNWLFKNLVWSDADVGDYADAMVLKMQNISWFPFEMWCAGLPYLETGDELEITNSEGTYTSYVLQRQLNGIQNLQDTFIDGELDIF